MENNSELGKGQKKKSNNIRFIIRILIEGK